jgi:hypothetical protein
VINVAQNRDEWWAVVNTVTHLWIYENVADFLTSQGPVSISRSMLLHLVSKCNYSRSHRGVEKTT